MLYRDISTQVCHQCERQKAFLLGALLETFRFENEDDCEEEIKLTWKFFFRAFPLTASSLSFSSDLVREVHARASVPLPSRAFSHARGHFRVSCDLLEGLRTRSLCILKKDTKKSFILIFYHHKS